VVKDKSAANIFQEDGIVVVALSGPQHSQYHTKIPAIDTLRMKGVGDSNRCHEGTDAAAQTARGAAEGVVSLHQQQQVPWARRRQATVVGRIRVAIPTTLR